MKHYFVYLLFCLLTSPIFSFGQKSPIITFKNKVCNFGTIRIKPYTVYKVKFYFRNSGNAPLQIYNISASCGCTKPYWTKKPIPEGVEDYISVLLKLPQNYGYVSKTIYVYTNSSKKVNALHIKGFAN